MGQNTKDQFWNSLLTEKSWKILHELKKRYSFIVIGGWAVYLLTRQQKSKDIDILVNILELAKFKTEELRKNDRLKKYEIKLNEIDLDIYVEYFSKFVIPAEELNKYTLRIDGFTVLSPEVLLILKQSAFKEREISVKGEKDKIDILSLLFFSGIDLSKYRGIIKKYSLDYFSDELKKILTNFKDYNYLNLHPKVFKIRKNKILAELRSL